MRTLALTVVAVALLAGCQSHKLPATCHLKPESGRCRAAIERWWYDDHTGECKAFIWGGCGGVVPFEAQQDCENTCRAGLPPEAVEGGKVHAP